MAALLAALLYFARPLKLGPLLHSGFAEPWRNLPRALIGFALAAGAVALILAAVAILGHSAFPTGEITARALRYSAAAIAIAIIEEGFFRAFVLGGLMRDFSAKRGALIASAAIYAAAHLMRAPTRFYLSGFHPRAGLDVLAASATRIIHPGEALPAILGLFLLGILLGQAFLITKRVYCSAGMHAGFVLGAKLWPAIAHTGAPVSRWLAGPGPVPLIAAPAAWVMAVVLILLLPALLGRRGHD
jgi:membrane protease YdiL (CAAX protease family)